MARRFEIEDTITRKYRRFGATGPQLVVRRLPPYDDTDSVSHFLASLNDLFRHALQILNESDMVGKTIQTCENQYDKPIGITSRRKGQLAADVILSLVQKASQSNATFNALDKLIMTVHSVRMPLVSASGRLKAGAGNSQSWPI